LFQATTNGSLNRIQKCFVIIEGTRITFNNLPDISDSKNANYNNEPIIGRSFPLYTYAYSGDRIINLQFHFFVVNPGDAVQNLRDLRLIQSAVYPRPGFGSAPYLPPPVCLLNCGSLLGDAPLCAVLQQYSVKFPTEVAWEVNTSQTFCPYRFDVDTTWLVVYSSSELPDQPDIVRSGR